MIFALLSIGLSLNALAAPQEDLVTDMPDFGKVPFKMYSGYVTVPGPVAGYDMLKIHYQLHMSQTNPDTDPLVTWHQGGPGGSAMYGLYTEMGYFQLDSEGAHKNDFAWNKIANMLYLESPAGSSVGIGGKPVGYSACYMGHVKQKTCKWNDTSQAEAYSKTLLAFLEKFPELKKNDLYLTGESYAGQYLPNIANYILTELPKGSLNLKGLALGNSCWGGTEDSVQCNGPNENRNDVELFYGKGLVSRKLRNEAFKVCGYDENYNATAEFRPRSDSCEEVLKEVFEVVGPHNVYNIYDNCPGFQMILEKTGKSVLWLTEELRKSLGDPLALHSIAQKHLGDEALEGGYDWSCGGSSAAVAYFLRKDVLEALHLDSTLGSGFDYDVSGPASITLYPFLAKNLHLMIYSGDADSCVPYKGTEEWTTMMETQNVIKTTDPWQPWYAGENQQTAPAGYVTKSVDVENNNLFTFVTVRLAGHMVPTFRPKASLTMFRRFLAGEY